MSPTIDVTISRTPEEQRAAARGKLRKKLEKDAQECGGSTREAVIRKVTSDLRELMPELSTDQLVADAVELKVRQCLQALHEQKSSTQIQRLYGRVLGDLAEHYIREVERVSTALSGRLSATEIRDIAERLCANLLYRRRATQAYRLLLDRS